MSSNQPTLEPAQRAMLERMINPTEPVQLFSGYAGTGKSTVLAQASAQRPTWPVLTPTNKAAAVLKQKGIPYAQTIHSAIYQPAPVEEPELDSAGNVIHLTDPEGNPLRDDDGKLIPRIKKSGMAFSLVGTSKKMPAAFIDEGSMVGDNILQDMLQHFESLTILLDDFQLPPVNGVEIARKYPPKLKLTEVHRTAAENPIMKYLTALRNGYDAALQPFLCDELRQCNYTNRHLFNTLVEKDVQAICYSNALRHTINDEIRKVKGYDHDSLRAGESLVALETVRYRIDEDTFVKYYNGEILTVAEDVRSPENFYQPVRIAFTNNTSHMSWPFWMKEFWLAKERHKGAEWNNHTRMLKAQGKLYGSPATFDFASCLTAHKAQGSQWPRVAVFMQDAILSKTLSVRDKLRWLYTANSRTQEQLLIVNC